MNMNNKHLLIIHPYFCIRAKKQVEALIENSKFKISIIANLNKKNLQLSDYIFNNTNVISFNFHKNIYHRMKFRHMLRKEFSNVDIIHCHNEPNYHIVDTIKVFSKKIPIIYDIHDLTSMRTGEKCRYEKVAYEHSNIIIHVSEKFINYGNELYIKKPSQVILSAPSKKYIINKTKTLIKKDAYDFVYQGGIFDPSWKKKWKYSYRNYYPIFKSILEEGHHLHLFTKVEKNKLPSYMILNNNYENFHFHKSLNYKELISKISEYDFGLAGFNFNDIQSASAKHYLNSALGNKMFDYLSAGIPVLTFNANAMSDFVKLNGCGFEKIESKSWTETIQTNINNSTIFSIANKFCMENQISKLISIYESLIKT